MLKIKSNRKAAFTLAETLITVVILGIVAAILVPSLIKNQVENANRTKVKKAMAAYEKAINFIILENDIKSTENLKELGQDNCQYTREYFKTVQDGTNNCIFKTADRVWWDITDITNPIISLKNEITDANEATIANNALSLNADTTSFALIGRFDDLGTLRVNDNAYEQGLKNNTVNQKYMKKLWYFITQSDSFLNEFDRCSLEKKNTCTISVNGKDTTYTRITTNTDTTIDTLANGNIISCIYDRNSNSTGTCNGYASTAPAGDYWISDNLGSPTKDEAKDMTGSVCNSQRCIDNGDYYEAAKRKCEAQGAHLATLAELSIARSNGKISPSVWYWASEEIYSTDSYTMHSNGYVGYHPKTYTYGQVICIGN